MAVKNVTELDFDTIKSNLKTFMQNQSEFQDYNFEASGISAIIDLLAYNTHYNAVLAHMVSNEAFLDSAVKRNSVVSIAKTMGYTPRSARAASAVVNITVVPDPSYVSNTLTITRDKIFSSTIQGKQFTFVPDTDYTITKTVENGVGAFRFTNVKLIEGVRTTVSEVIGSLNRSGPVVLSTDNVDTTTIRVRIQTSALNAALTTFTESASVLSVTSTSKVYYLEERTDGHYQINFGDGILGQQLDADNIVLADFIVTNGSKGNGARNFRTPTNFTGNSETVTGTTVTAAAGGFDRETIDSIRFNAPRFNSAKGRVVTKSDYESTVKASNPNIKSVTAWGGEDNIPPIYGKIFLSLQAASGFVITQSDKDTIENSVLAPKMPIGLQLEFVDPDTVFIGFNISVTYDPKLTTSTLAAIQSTVSSTVETHFNTNLNELKKNFFYSKLSKEINDVSTSIIGNNIEMRLMKKITPTTGSLTRYEPKYNNKILPLSIRTNFFTADLNGAREEVYLTDKPNADVIAPAYSGQGILQLKTKSTNTIVAQNIGTIDYDTGALDITSLNISSISGDGNTLLRIVATPHESSKNISTDLLIRSTSEQSYVVEAVPSRNIILSLDDSVEDLPNNIKKGVSVTVAARVTDD